MTKPIGQVLCVMAVFVCSSAFAQPATAPATEPSAYAAERFVKIKGADVNWPLLVEELQDQAAKLGPQMVGVSEAAVYKIVDIRSVMVPSGIGQNIKIDIDPKMNPGAKPNAPAFADLLVTRLKKLVAEKDAEARRSEIDPIEKAIAESQSRIQNMQNGLVDLRNQLRQKTGRVDVSATQLNEAALKIDDQRQDLELEKLGKQSRIKAIQDAIARLSKQVEQKVQDDPIAAELKKVVDAREHQVKNAQVTYNADVGRYADLQNAIAQAAEAKAKLLERQRESAADAGGGQIDSLNQELTTLNIDLAEIDAKLTALNQDRNGLQWALDHVDQLTHLSAELADEQKDLDSAKQNLRQTQERLNQTPPVTIRVVRSSNG